MKKEISRAAVLTAALVFAAGCGTQAAEQTLLATEEAGEQYLSAEEAEEDIVIMQEYSETDAYPKLAAFLINYYQIPEEYQTETRYYYNYTDLNDDGTEEIVALVVGESISKNSGDCMVILEPDVDETFTLLEAFTNIHTPITVCDETVNGWHKIIYEVYGGVQEAGSMICHYEETGGYQSDQNEFVEKLEPVAGIQILSNNLIDDMDQGNYLTLAPNTQNQ